MAVMVAWLHGGTVAGDFAYSLVRMLGHDTVAGGGHVFGGGATLAVRSGTNVSRARNDVVRAFLGSTCSWLLMLDSDMVFEPDLLERLLVSADRRTRPIVGGLCFGVSHDGTAWPTLYSIRDDMSVVRWELWPEDEIVAVSATGAACLLVHRRVFEGMAGKYPEPLVWFSEQVVGGQVWSEDLVFCVRAQASGFPVHVDTGILVGHRKDVTVNGEYHSCHRGVVSSDPGIEPDPQVRAGSPPGHAARPDQPPVADNESQLKVI